MSAEAARCVLCGSTDGRIHGMHDGTARCFDVGACAARPRTSDAELMREIRRVAVTPDAPRTNEARLDKARAKWREDFPKRVETMKKIMGEPCSPEAGAGSNTTAADFPVGATVRTVDPDDQSFEGEIGVVVERAPARYVFVRFPDDERTGHRGHPFRPDELRIESVPDLRSDKARQVQPVEEGPCLFRCGECATVNRILPEYAPRPANAVPDVTDVPCSRCGTLYLPMVPTICATCAFAEMRPTFENRAEPVRGSEEAPDIRERLGKDRGRLKHPKQTLFASHDVIRVFEDVFGCVADDSLHTFIENAIDASIHEAVERNRPETAPPGRVAHGAVQSLVRAADRAMHVVWTAAVGTPGYDKRAWQALEHAIWAMAEKGGEDGC